MCAATVLDLRSIRTLPVAPKPTFSEMAAAVFKRAGDPCTCYVGNISWTTTSDDLTAYFSGAGKVLQCEVAHHLDTGRSKGWAIVKFGTPSEAVFAIEQFDQQVGTRRHGKNPSAGRFAAWGN